MFDKKAIGKTLITLALICFLGFGVMVLGVLFNFPGFTHPTGQVSCGMVLTECTFWAGWTTFGLLGLAVSLMSVGLTWINPLYGAAWSFGLWYVTKDHKKED